MVDEILVLYVASGPIGISQLFVFHMMYWAMCKKTPINIPYDDLVTGELTTYFKDINNRIFIKRGIVWRTVPGNYWIEMKIDRKLATDKEK